MSKKLIVLAVVVSSFAFQYKKKKLIPPGTVQITETYFADETEVSNLSWQEYEFWVKYKYGVNSKEHREVLPDTQVWRNTAAGNEAYVTHYYRHLAYKDHPVVGVSYEQVVAFCRWRTDRVKEFYALTNKKDIKLECTLPTREQWEFFSSNGAYFSNNGKNKKGMGLLNCRRENDTLLSSANNTSDVLAPVYSYYQNSFGMFNTLGNVSEMILEKGNSKEGSWYHSLEECRPGKDILYSKTEAWLGFRCVCILKYAS